jgi:hypothetical protein
MVPSVWELSLRRKNFIAMNLQRTLEALLLWGIYPLWLVAGAGDYLCHRQSDIEHTSGSKESCMHVVQFSCLLLAFSLAVLVDVNAVVFGAMLAMVLLHSAMVWIDVFYTDGRRYISPVEQQVHGFMEVLPLVAVALFGVLHWPAIDAPIEGPMFALRSSLILGDWLLWASFPLLAGSPVLEELARTRRYRVARDARFQAGLATIK